MKRKPTSRALPYSVAVMQEGEVVDLTPGLALAAARISVAERLPMADSVILAAARQHGAILWTQDEDFAGMDGIRYVAK